MYADFLQEAFVECAEAGSEGFCESNKPSKSSTFYAEEKDIVQEKEVCQYTPTAQKGTFGDVKWQRI